MAAHNAYGIQTYVGIPYRQVEKMWHEKILAHVHQYFSLVLAMGPGFAPQPGWGGRGVGGARGATFGDADLAKGGCDQPACSSTGALSLLQIR